jgi:hypothetical protein
MLSLPAASISFIVSYKKKSIKIAFTFASASCRRISRLISSTHQMLQPVGVASEYAVRSTSEAYSPRICSSQLEPLSINWPALTAASNLGL